ncbi:interferon-inducible GTPase 1-like [Mercenaria mercenaria]|uniref:interferon-inducible GTPase 1-like n=1 Tax=Mercenaria mercenaria TaxID=6596 RepID=UPI00234EAD78|nr:interferon-inducible GTPase 1-like [Mercenaria mercenaria]
MAYLQMASNRHLSEPEGLQDKVAEELSDVYKEEGATGLLTRVRENLNEWRNIPLNIAVTGDSGAGKSSYINALLGINLKGTGAAKVDVVETTKDNTPYQHPEHPNLILWDLPGIGTANFPQKTYVEKVNFKKFDFFLILSSDRFTENDMWLAEQVKLLDKSFYFIRTKIDADIRNDKRAHPRTHSADKVVAKIRQHTLQQLRHIFHNPLVFLINNFKKDEFDFQALAERLIEDAPNIKKEALVLSLTLLTGSIIREKEKYLNKRIYVVSVASAIAGAVPVPGVGSAVDIAILLEEAVFYRRQLRLDDASLQIDANSLKTPLDELKTKLQLKSTVIQFTAKGLLAFFAGLGISNVAENALKIAIPIIGSLLSAGLSYGTQVYCLKSLLKVMVKDARSKHRQISVMMAENISK